MGAGTEELAPTQGAFPLQEGPGKSSFTNFHPPPSHLTPQGARWGQPHKAIRQGGGVSGHPRPRAGDRAAWPSPPGVGGSPLPPPLLLHPQLPPRAQQRGRLTQTNWPATHGGKAAGRAVSPPEAGPSFLTQSTAPPPLCGPQGSGVTPGPNKGPSELLSAPGWRGRGGQASLPAPDPTWQEPSRKPRWHCQGCEALRGRPWLCWGSGGTLASEPAAQPVAQPGLAPPGAGSTRECRLPQESWNSRQGSDKEGPRQIDATGQPSHSPVYVCVWGQGCLLIHPPQAEPTWSPGRGAGGGGEAHQNESIPPPSLPGAQHRTSSGSVFLSPLGPEWPWPVEQCTTPSSPRVPCSPPH